MCGLSMKIKNAFLAMTCLLTIFSNAGFAEEAITLLDVEPEPETDSRSAVDWLIDTRNDWSHGLDYMASSIDGFLAGKDSETQANKSYLRLRLGARWVEGNRLADDTDFKLRIDLPATTKRWQLFIENQLAEFEQPGNSNREDLITPQTTDDSFYGGISRERTTEYWQLRPELGLKLSFPLNPFARFRATRPFELPDLWDGRYQQSFYYFHRGGFGVKAQLSFERPWGEKYFWRIKTEGNWQDETNNTSLAQIFSLQQSLSDKAAMVYEMGVLGVTKPSTQTSGYYSTVRYRQQLYRDWLFWDVVPAVSWTRTTDFDPVYSITTRIEILFSD